MQYYVYNEIADDFGTFDTPEEAEGAAQRERETCAVICGADVDTAGETPGRGNFECGVLSPHGIHVQEVDTTDS